MPGLTCNACNKEFDGDSEQKLHYKSEWHRYNLQRKIAGVPGVTEALFIAKQAALAAERSKENEAHRGYRGAKAHAQHLPSRAHVLQASQGNANQIEETIIIKPLPQRLQNNDHVTKAAESEEIEESDDEWEEVDPEEEMIEDLRKSMNAANMKTADADDEMKDGDDEDDEFDQVLDPSTYFMCDKEHNSTENCIVHLHNKVHAYVSWPKDFTCLYCNDRRRPFNSLEAVRKHMDAKSHCKIHYGDDGQDEVEFEEFYDYSSSYADMGGAQLLATDDVTGISNLEVVDQNLSLGKEIKILCQLRLLGQGNSCDTTAKKPRPANPNDSAITIALSYRYKSMGLITTALPSREKMNRLKVFRQMNRHSVEHVRSKMGMKPNVIRHLPNNVTY